MHLSISNDIVSTKFYDKRDDFDFEVGSFPLLDGDGPRSTSYGVLIVSIPDLCILTYFFLSQLIRFGRTSSHVADFNTRNRLLT